jgi:6-phosphogluconolactonase
MKSSFVRPALAGLMVLFAFGCNSGGSDNRAVVYAMTNAAVNNSVMAWRVNANGTLESIGGFSTNGNGTGTTETPLAGPNDGIDPLASQGSLTLSPDQQFLYAVNAGSGTLAVFRVAGNGGLTLIDTESTGGTSPVSVTARGNLVYVVNVNDPVNAQPSTITGFTVNTNGTLTAIAGSTRQLSAANARPSQVSITPDATQVIVTERETDVISTFAINGNGTLGAPTTTPSPRPAPFGFDFSGNGTVIVSEAAPMDPLGSSASSYTIGVGSLSVVSAGVLNGQAASCWTNVSPDGTRAYVANTASDTVTTYGVALNAVLTVRQAAVPTDGAGSGPIDADLNASGTMYFQLLGGKGTIAVYSVDASGDLTLTGVRATGLPMLGTQGLTVRR